MNSAKVEKILLKQYVYMLCFILILFREYWDYILSKFLSTTLIYLILFMIFI